MKPRPSNQVIRTRLQDWFKIHRRDLPWRLPAGRQAGRSDPYRIMISEVMLQQTQVDRVIPKYNAWLKAFPTIQSLARAPLQKVLQLWSGLGYNSRAARLRELARVVVEKYDGKFPSDVEQLESLPGIGPYTARAIASFAFGQDTEVIDTNVRRVVSRIFFGLRQPSKKSLQTAVSRLVPPGQSGQWNGTLMDFGALVCQSRRPKCETCPVKNHCRAYPAVLRPLKQQQQPKRIRFEETDRFWRGRIVYSLVHKGPMSDRNLQRALKKYGSLASSRFNKLAKALATTGIVRRTGQQLSIQA